MVKIRDVAQRAGVGVSTVSRTLNESGYVDPGTRKRVLTAVEELGYRPNAVARALRSRRTGTVGFIVPDLRNQFYAEGSAMLQASLEAAGYQLLVGVSRDDLFVESRCFAAFHDQRVDAVVSIPVGDTLPGGQGVPVIEMNRSTGNLQCDSVVSDEMVGLRQLTGELLAAGHRKIALVVGPARWSTAANRTEGFKRAVDGVPGAVGEVFAGDFSPEWGREAAAVVLASGATGVVVASSAIMEGFAAYCSYAGVSIPEDVSVVSVGDPPWFSFWQGGITTYAPDLGRIGDVTAKRVLVRLREEASQHEPVHLVVDGRIIERGSVARPPSGHGLGRNRLR
ncbi:LacI family DNA-binding transcriptional regulator [Corynebacterium sp.]|uniref:LacI family DNA-binding transcriptional regulator n=1 Tax=Corynebacterium sp. TaxID=1720 RepID=UPI0028A5CE98|nr:LacI family DNA-binding transcriptional regulator [Corynebacterium sp.]